VITKKDKVTVAIFVLGTLAILVGTLGALWGVNATRPMKRYTIVTTSSVSGLNKSAAVNYLGANVGKVERIDIGPGEVTLTISVKEDTPITKDTKAQLTAQGITGIQFIELVPGTSKVPLDPDSRIEFIPSSFQEIVSFFSENKAKVSDTIANANLFLQTATAAVVSGQGALERVSSRLDAILDEDRESIKKVLDRADAVATDLAEIVARLKDRRVADEFADTLESTKHTIGDVDKAVEALSSPGQSQTALGDAIADLRSTARSAGEATAAARDLLNRLGPGLEDDLSAVKGTLEQVDRAVRTLQDVAAELRGRPSLIVRDLSQPRRSIPDK
jgi:phospholipid/cholesterol/gamma-HCH transport system substrate-binding protein